ncbi:rhodanese-like domain-containing protein [Caldimonas thermodepolymerans]|uniref:rhodanese-like domain-containing protein n=1 Tax=Caldimonas thermodepolymerans TaxID=215580 RepID=UPI0022358FAC|nr:rhodanese-like domain-containing protein [Caldimonas thermodepolymerans]UZG43201.1 rhodanese-like domain-containing protein [Caldimonas thermodepolymerans]
MLRQLTAHEVRDLLAATAAGDDAPQLLDVREPWEVAVAAIDPGRATALHIPMQEIPARLSEIDPERTVVCVCHHGMRSLHVAHYLARQGYDDVVNLHGGIDAWSQQVDPGVPRY